MTEYLPFVRPAIGETTRRGVCEVLESGWITSGPQVAAFEQELGTYLGGRPTLCFGHATGAMEEVLRALELEENDEVIVPAMTFAATLNVVWRVGARPVLVDVDPLTRNLTAEAVAKVVTERTRVIMPVHFAGLSVDLDSLYALARERGLRVVEDAAHAIGTRYRERRIGSFGDIVCFSFHANKNLTTIEGGAVCSDDKALMERLRLLRFHGQEKLDDGGYDILFPASKHNLSDVAARIGRDQLAVLDERNAQRLSLASRYFSELEGLRAEGRLQLPARGDAGHAWHMFTVRIPYQQLGTNRQAVRAKLHEHGIGTGVHYPSLSTLTVTRERNLGVGQSFEAAEAIGRETLTLPLFPEMQASDVERVARALAEVLHG